jgi:hypothetical protein
VKENKTRTKKGLCRSETVILPLSYGLFEEEQEEKKKWRSLSEINKTHISIGRR